MLGNVWVLLVVVDGRRESAGTIGLKASINQENQAYYCFSNDGIPQPLNTRSSV